MAITFVGSNSNFSNPNVSSLSVTLPPHQAGDFAILVISHYLSGIDVTCTSGWTELIDQNYTGRSGNTDRIAVYYRRLASSSETSPVASFTSSGFCTGTVHVFRGVDTASPFDTAYTSTTFNRTSTSSASIGCPSITTATDASCLISAIVGSTTTSIFLFSHNAPSGFTQGAYTTAANGGNNPLWQFVGYDLDAGSAGLKSPGNWTINWTSSEDYRGVSLSFALRPGSAEGTLSKTLGALSVSSAGSVDVEGSTSATLGALTVSSAGEVYTVTEGTLEATLGELTASSTAEVAIEGAASQSLGALTASSAGSVTVAGEANPTLGALTATSEGTVTTVSYGTLEATLGTLSASAAGELNIYIPAASPTSPAFSSAANQENPTFSASTSEETTYTNSEEPVEPDYITLTPQEALYE